MTETKKLRNKSFSVGGKIVKYFILSLAALTILIPFYVIVITAFKASHAVATHIPFIWFPKFDELSFRAFGNLFTTYTISTGKSMVLTGIINTFIIVIPNTVVGMISSSVSAYAFAKLKFKGKNFLFNLILIGMMIPYQVTQVPLYILIVNKFHLANSYAALVLPGLVTSYNIFLTKQFFSSIPTSLLESAKLDGCSQPKIFTHIVLPLSKTILAVLSINTFLASWNNFFWPFLVTTKDAMYTIQVGLKQFKFANTTLFGPMMAGATISALPMFVLFFCLQKYFLEGVTVGAVKG